MKKIYQFTNLRYIVLWNFFEILFQMFQGRTTMSLLLGVFLDIVVVALLLEIDKNYEISKNPIKCFSLLGACVVPSIFNVKVLGGGVGVGTIRLIFAIILFIVDSAVCTYSVTESPNVRVLTEEDKEATASVLSKLETIIYEKKETETVFDYTNRHRNEEFQGEVKEESEVDDREEELQSQPDSYGKPQSPIGI